jgi:hypothetical protein
LAVQGSTLRAWRHRPQRTSDKSCKLRHSLAAWALNQLIPPLVARIGAGVTKHTDARGRLPVRPTVHSQGLNDLCAAPAGRDNACRLWYNQVAQGAPPPRATALVVPATQGYLFRNRSPNSGNAVIYYSTRIPPGDCNRIANSLRAQRGRFRGRSGNRDRRWYGSDGG